MLKNKNNINERLKAVKSENKAVLKTKGINTKTSGTMTLTIGILTNVIEKCLKKDMGFFEEVIFKEKNINKFIEISNINAIKVSTIKPFSCDELIEDELANIKSGMI